MSLIEFQVSTSAFLAAQRTALRSMQICTPPQTVAGVQIIIEKIDFGNNALRHNSPASFSVFFSSLTSDRPGEEVDGFQTQIAQDVTVYITTLNDIMGHPNQPPATIIAVQGTVVFNVDFYSLEEDCYTTIGFKALEPGPLPAIPAAWQVSMDQLLAAVNNELRSRIPSKAIPAGLSQLTTLFAKFENAGVSVDGQLQRICFRAQIGGSHPGVKYQWENFFKGNFSDRLGGADWAFFIESGLITENIKAKINQAIAEADIDHLQTFPGCNYSNAGGKAVFTLDVEAIYDLPDPLGTVSRDPKLPLEISVSAQNTLRLRVDYSDVISLIHSFAIVEFVLPSLTNAIEGFLQTMIDMALADVNKTQGAPYCKKIAPTVVECIKTVQMPQAAAGTTSIMTSLLAQDDGIAMTGTMRSVSLSPAVISTRVREFQWQPPKISCSAASIALVAAFMDSTDGFVLLQAAGIVDNQGTTPLYLCSWNIVPNSDKLGVFLPSFVLVDAGPAGISFSVNIPVPKSPYYDNPYPLLLLVKTTAGMRLLKIAPPPKITKTEIDKLAAELLVKVGNCEQLVDPWFSHHGGYNPAWSVDPPFESRVDHLWQVEITGLRQGETASLVDSAGKELVRATARVSAPVFLSALIPPSGAKELTVMRGGGQRAALKEAAVKTPRGIQVGQQLMIQSGSIALGEACHSLRATSIFSGRCLIAVLQNGIRAYDFENPMRPACTRSWEIPGVRGVLDWQGALLHFGDNGFGWIDSGGGRREGGSACCANPILDAVVIGQVLCAITKEGLDIYSQRLCKIGSIAIEGANSLVQTAGKLVVGGRGGIHVYKIGSSRAPQCVISAEGIHVQSLTRPLGAEAGTVLATLEDGSARLFHVTGKVIEETAHFAQAPWFAGSIRLGGLLIQTGHNSTSLDISRFGKSAVI